MYEIACKDLGMDCNFVAKGETKTEVAQAAFAHAGKVHADVFAKMNSDQMAEMEKVVVSKIKTI